MCVADGASDSELSDYDELEPHYINITRSRLSRLTGWVYQSSQSEQQKHTNVVSSNNRTGQPERGSLHAGPQANGSKRIASGVDNQVCEGKLSASRCRLMEASGEASKQAVKESSVENHSDVTLSKIQNGVSNGVDSHRQPSSQEQVLEKNQRVETPKLEEGNKLKSSNVFEGTATLTSKMQSEAMLAHSMAVKPTNSVAGKAAYAVAVEIESACSGNGDTLSNDIPSVASAGGKVFTGRSILSRMSSTNSSSGIGLNCAWTERDGLPTKQVCQSGSANGSSNNTAKEMPVNQETSNGEDSACLPTVTGVAQRIILFEKGKSTK